ncbi:hypothetical protein [Helicobacter fennelliae]|uniref:Uncharacterized protein n=1 Tax=Helicobacter fennelliae MRY12-0050 TaxID=1325130 RepID=T1D0N7_9HELI|nr:hypothetical protein [Helicobacter fennelliae]GAD19785.1 hypothetical protein HFN_1025 [Helicobacter fennelliae MRY12-0050]
MLESRIQKWILIDCHTALQLLAMTSLLHHCEDDRTKQSSQNRLPQP